MAENLSTLVCLSANYFNNYQSKHFFFLIIVSFVSSSAQILFFNNLAWIFNGYWGPLDINLLYVSRLRLIFNRNTPKNIYYGTWNDTKVVIKEFHAGEECKELNLKECRLKYLKHVEFTSNSVVKSLAVCPTSDGFRDVIPSHLFNNISFESLTEPFVLDALKSDAGWPTPKSFGLRGNVLIEEYVGPSLSTLAPVDWKTRAKIAVELLKMAHAFTNGHERFSFYFSDISPDNIAIRKNMEAVLVDLDNVIIVDRQSFGSVETQHVSEVADQSDDGFTFSTEDICKHPISDFNYYVICEHIFRRSSLLPNNGLLNDLPETVENKYPEIKRLLEECAAPSRTRDRITAGKKLQNILNTTLEFNFLN